MNDLLEKLPASAIWSLLAIGGLLLLVAIVVTIRAVLDGRKIKIGWFEIGSASSARPGKQNSLERTRDSQQTMVGWTEVANAVTKLHENMKNRKYRPSYIVCMGRGGGVVGAMLSQKFEKPVVPVIVLTMDHRMGVDEKDSGLPGRYRADGVNDCCAVKEGLNGVLLLGVDIITGTALQIGARELKQKGVTVTATACLFRRPGAALEPTFFAEECTGRYLYPWMKLPFHEVWGIDG